MSNKKTRGVFAALAAGAMALSMAPNALADLNDPDGSPVVIVPDEKVSKAEVFRIADVDRIATAVEASQSRTDWGHIITNQRTRLVWACAPTTHYLHGKPVTGAGWKAGDKFYPLWAAGGKRLVPGAVECTVTEKTKEWVKGDMHIIVARSDDYPDALAAAPLADVLNAPILLHPTVITDGKGDANGNGLRDDVEAEITRLAKIGESKKVNVSVHLLGGTQALSHAVENAIDKLPNVDETLRYQGLNRYETATNIARVTVDRYGLASGADGNDVNVYLTTGENFPDALSAGAAASNNDGVVLLTQGTKLDTYNFTLDFVKGLENWVRDDKWDINTSEIFAVGGPSAAASTEIDLAASYVGVNRYETATLTAQATFGNPKNYAVVSGETFPDALVASGYIANLDGPLLLTEPTSLNQRFTAAYLTATVDDGDRIFTFGGPDSLRLAVTNQIRDLLKAKFAVDPEIQ